MSFLKGRWRLTDLFLVHDWTRKGITPKEDGTDEGYFRIGTVAGLQKWAETHPREFAHIQTLLANQFAVIWPRPEQAENNHVPQRN